MIQEGVLLGPFFVRKCLRVLNIEVVAKLGVDYPNGIPDDTLRFV
jgi:hypothetical protein